MTVKPIRDALPDEHVMQVYPELRPFVDETWRRRLNLYTGRSLSAEALQQEQTVRIGHLAHRGQLLSPGVVTGLEVTLGNSLPSHPLESTLHLSAGLGLTAQGEDVVLPTPRVIHLGDLPLYVPIDRLVNPVKTAIQHLFLRSQTSQPLEQTTVTLPPTAAAFTLPEELHRKYGYDPETRVLSVIGPMTEAERRLLLPPAPSGTLAQRVLTEATWQQQYEQRQAFEAAIAQLFDDTQESQPDKRQTITLPMAIAFTLPSNLPADKYTFNASSGELSITGSMTPLERDLLLAGYTAADLTANLPKAGILVLQPVTYIVRGKPDPSDPCDEDPTNDAYEDQQWVDGCRVVLYLYPDEWLPMPERDERWRNRLAYSIFWAERNHEPDQVMPWEDIGVPIALIGFDDTWTPLFADRHAVVRVGGLPKRRHKLLREAGNPFLWHARIQQFAEQLAELDLPNLPPDTLHQAFRYLPPVGVLPKNAIQPRQGQNYFFPARLTVQAVPIPLEQLDLVVQESASLVPFDLFNADFVQVLVPVPQTWYEPRLLINEQVSPLFGQTLRQLRNQRDTWLKRRILVRQRAKALIQARTSRPPEYPALDPEALGDEVQQRPNWFSRRVIQADATQTSISFGFRGASDTLRPEAGDQLTLYVYLDPFNPPNRFEVRWLTNRSLVRSVVWQRLPDSESQADPQRRALPPSGQWIRLAVSARLLELENSEIYGLLININGGQMSWGHAGKARLGASPVEDQIWLGDTLPLGAEIIQPVQWSWIDVDFMAIAAQLEANALEAEYTKGETPFSSARALVSPLSEGAYAFTDATTPLTIFSGDRLTAYVYLDPAHPPTRIRLWWRLDDRSDRLYRVYWGEPLIYYVDHIHLGELPEPGEWVRLTIPTFSITGTTISGMAFLVEGGRVAWAHLGKSAAGSSPSEDMVWVGDGLPAGAVSSNAPDWNWVRLSPTTTPFSEPETSIPMLQEEAYQTVLRDGVRVALPLEKLQLDLREHTPLTRDAIALPQATTFALPIALLGKFSFDTRSKILTVVGVMTDNELKILLGQITTGDADAAKIREAIAHLYDYSQDNDDVFTLLQQTGVEGLVQDLDAKVNQLDDKIDFGFLRIQTNTYRLRQFVLGTETAGRLAVSPALAQIAKIDSAYATQQQLSNVFQTLKDNPDQPLEGIARSAVPQESLQVRAQPDILQGSSKLSRATDSAVFTTNLGQTTAKKLDVKTVSIQESAAKEAATKIAAVKVSNFEKVQSVQQQVPIVGKVQRTISIAERLKQPRSSEARDLALATKRDIVADLASINILKDLAIPGVEGITFGQLKTPADRARVLTDILQGVYDPLPTGSAELQNQSNEAVYFAAASKTLDDAVAILRVAEGRVQEYRAAIALCQATLDQLLELESQVTDRLAVIGTELGETRHDLSVARALLAEEEARVAEINTRRDRIVRENVPFLVFHRPRVINSLIQGPTRLLNPATSLLDDPVPTCLRQVVTVPPQLGAMVDLLKEAPVSWFTHLPMLLDRLDRLEMLQNVVNIAMGRAKVPLAATQLMQAIAPTPGPFAQSLMQTVSVQHQFVQQRRQQTAQLDMNFMVNQTWKQMRDRAETLLSLGDLIDGGHGRPDLIKQASDRLRDMSHVAACLYARFAEVLPAIRLIWAQQLSQYDTPFSLQTLSRLPRWGEIDYLQQRDLQTLSYWLYRQINPTQEEAVSFITDLVRVCILLASHAPVNRIIAGRVMQDTPVVVGNPVKVAIDRVQVTVGMTVLMYAADNQIVARGVVDDLGQGQVAARIVQSLQPNTKLLANSRVQFTTQRF